MLSMIPMEEPGKTMYLVTISHNDFAKEFYAFNSLDEAVPYFKGRLKKLFAEAHTDVDDNGETLDDCVIMGECLLNDNYHGIDVMLKREEK